jgi:DNA polymerase-3 subunit delta'
VGFDSFLGQPTAKTTIERALKSGKVHHAYRFEGPDGVGKTTLALLLGAALLCENDQFGCGVCSSCGRALALSSEPPIVPKHPDFVFVGRGVYPSNIIGASEATGISVEQIRRIVLPRVGYPPHEGKALVIVIFNAEELSIAAANALLKTLEEPAPKTHFILLTSRPGRLLDTIRSRTLAVRFGALPEKVVAQILEREGHDPSLAALAEGSLSQARLLAETEMREQRERFVKAALDAVGAKHPAAGVRFADERPDGRDELLASLAFLAATCAARAREEEGYRALSWANRYRSVVDASRQIERNAAPALVLESMILHLRASH